MPDLSNFCKPHEEMDEIARKLRAHEESIDYVALFQRAQIAGAGIVRPEDEMDVAATSARYQSEQEMGVESALKKARRVHKVIEAIPLERF